MDELIKEFYHDLLEYFPEVNTSLFEENLKTLKVNYTNQFLTDRFAMGMYNHEKNTITIKRGFEKNKLIIYHELLHLASFKKKDNYSNIGFCLRIGDKKLGYSINEGLTEIIAEVLATKGDPSRLSGSAQYIYYKEKKLVKILFDIIGKDFIIDAYFNGDLTSLINELIKYSDKDSTIKFIKYCDYIESCGLSGILLLTNKKYLFVLEYLEQLKINKKNKIFIKR